MIFVAVGTQKFQIDRLLKKLDELKGEGLIPDELFAQTGSCTYQPKNYAYSAFLTKEEFEERIRDCDFVITHSGVNTIVSALRYHKKVIVFPRLVQYGEHVDDHQCQIASAFARKNYVLFCKDETELLDRIRDIPAFEPVEYDPCPCQIVDSVEDYLKQTEWKNVPKQKVPGAKTVLMCGSDIATVGGGMVSVIRQYLSRNGEDGYYYIYVPTHIEKGKLRQSLYYARAYIRIFGLLAGKKVDLVHLNCSERGSFFRKAFIVRLSKLFHVRVIIHNHAAEMEVFYQKLPKPLRAYMTKTYEMADLNIALSTQAIGRILSVAPKAKIEVLNNAVSIPEKNEYDSSRRNILYLGRLGERKGVYDLLKVIKRLDTKLPSDVKFYLCGDGDVDKVKKIVEDEGIGHRVLHVGWVDGAHKQKIFSETAVNILPSYNEGLPMTILETMANGIPNISTRIASIPEVIADGENGLLIEPGDLDAMEAAILRLMGDDKLREAFSKASHDLIKNRFSLDAHMQELHRIYGVALMDRK